MSEKKFDSEGWTKENWFIYIKTIREIFISEFVKDLKELQYGFDMSMFRDKIKKWEKKL